MLENHTPEIMLQELLLWHALLKIDLAKWLGVSVRALNGMLKHGDVEIRIAQRLNKIYCRFCYDDMNKQTIWRHMAKENQP